MLHDLRETAAGLAYRPASPEAAQDSALYRVSGPAWPTAWGEGDDSSDDPIPSGPEEDYDEDEEDYEADPWVRLSQNRPQERPHIRGDGSEQRLGTLAGAGELNPSGARPSILHR